MSSTRLMGFRTLSSSFVGLVPGAARYNPAAVRRYFRNGALDLRKDVRVTSSDGADRVSSNEFVIRGVTLDGHPFRPSDWAERLCGVMSQFGADGRMQYSPYVQPITSEGVKCVVVDERLREVEPLAYNFLVSFAKDNELQVRRGRRAPRSGGK